MTSPHPFYPFNYPVCTDIFFASLSPPTIPHHRLFAVERSVALKEKHNEAEIIKAIILGDKAASQKAIVSLGGNNITDGSMIKEKPPTTMLNSGHSQSFFGDITRSFRYSLSGGTSYSSTSKVFVGQAIIEEEVNPVGDELADVHPGSRISFKRPNKDDYNTSGKSMNGKSGKSFRSLGSGKSFRSNGASGKNNTSGKSVLATAVYQEIDDTAAHALAAHFADAVLPDESLSFADHFDGEHHLNLFDSFSWRTMMILLENHYMTHFWIGGPSLAKSRCLRYMVSKLTLPIS